jgi:7,8-dihydro-6-hydroxymethylpterin-pyrophosphokinase
MAHVRFQKTVQILQSAGSSELKRLSYVWQSEPAGNQMPQMSYTNPAQLGEMQQLRAFTIH